LSTVIVPAVITTDIIGNVFEFLALIVYDLEADLATPFMDPTKSSEVSIVTFQDPAGIATGESVVSNSCEVKTSSDPLAPDETAVVLKTGQPFSSSTIIIFITCSSDKCFLASEQSKKPVHVGELISNLFKGY